MIKSFFYTCCVLYAIYKLLEFIAKKIFGGRTAEEKYEENLLRKKQMVESTPQIVDSLSL